MFLLVTVLAIIASTARSQCTFLGYDLSPIGNQQISVPDRDQPATYQYFVSVCGNLQNQCDDITAGQKERGNVYQMGSPQTQVLCWCVSSKWNTNNPPKAIKTPNGIALVTQNGDNCKQTPRKNTLNLICDLMASTPTGYGYQDPQDPCHFIIDLKTKVTCSQGPSPKPTPKPGNCKFAGIDLKKLANQTVQVPDSKQNGFKYNVSLCGNMTGVCKDITTGSIEKGNVFRLGGANAATCVYVSSKWVGYPIVTKNSYSVTLKFQTGDPCGSRPRSTIIDVMCKPNTPVVSGYGFVDPSDSCVTQINLFSDVVCAQMEQHPDFREFEDLL